MEKPTLNPDMLHIAPKQEKAMVEYEPAEAKARIKQRMQEIGISLVPHTISHRKKDDFEQDDIKNIPLNEKIITGYTIIQGEDDNLIIQITTPDDGTYWVPVTNGVPDVSTLPSELLTEQTGKQEMSHSDSKNDVIVSKNGISNDTGFGKAA